MGAVDPSPAGAVELAGAVGADDGEPEAAFLSSANLPVNLNELGGELPPRLVMNIQNILLSIVIKGSDALARRCIQSIFKVPHQTRSSGLCLLVNGIFLVHGSSTLGNAILLVGG